MMKLKNSFSDTMVMANRILKHGTRSMDTLITVVAMPIFMMLMFVYIFGGAMNTGDQAYINFIVPGILIMCVSSGVAYTSLRINMDVLKGIFERFHSMPISKGSIIGGHVLSSVIFNIISTIVVLLVAFLIGFRPEAGIAEWLLVILIIILFTFALTYLAILFGLIAKSFEGAGAWSYLLLMLLFISSAFAPTETMLGVVRAFAENQPLTHIIEGLRSLFLGKIIISDVLTASAWCIGILIVSYMISMKVYRNKNV